MMSFLFAPEWGAGDDARVERGCQSGVKGVSKGAKGLARGWGDWVDCVSLGRLAQRESTRFTREGSLVQIQYRPPQENPSGTIK